jgi:mRNA (guanine-N7-)-methyltransferase
VPTGASLTDGGGFGDDRGDDIGAGLWGWNGGNNASAAPESNDNRGWDNSNKDNGGWDTAWKNVDTTAASSDAGAISGWSAVDSSGMNDREVFHANSGAAAADAFYSNLTRSLDTRADSRLFHMRNFNGWVKATQIAELDPDTSSRASSSSSSGAGNSGKKRSRISPLRVLDLACGKGGDLGKWTIHPRKIDNYVGVDVARGSLVDAALRARQMSRNGKSNVLRRCTFTLADLGEDVPGRKRSRGARRMQKLQTWTLQSETSDERDRDPVFVAREGGGIAETDKFDVVSIQFAIHYMMSTRKRARRFFNTVSSLLDIGGNLIATTIDARVVVEKLMALGLDYHFDDFDFHPDVDIPESEGRHRNGNLRRKVRDGEGATVSVGQGVCRLKFDADTLRKLFRPTKSPEDMFGLQYTFTLVEGSDHAAGVGEAVDLPEWLTPIAALEELAKESGLKLEYVSDFVALLSSPSDWSLIDVLSSNFCQATNFHQFYEERKNPTKFPMAHNALYNMKVLNRSGSLSDQEWDVSRMYIALKFCKVSESNVELGDEDVGEDEMRDDT